MSDEERVGALEKEILAQADARAAETIDRAERIAHRIARGAARRAEEIRRATERALAPRVESERTRAVALAEIEMRRKEAEAREHIVERALAEAREELSKWRKHPDYAALLTTLLADGVAVLPGTNFTVELSAEDIAIAEEKRAEIGYASAARAGRTVNLTIETSATPFLGGVRVTAEDGRSRVDQTFEGRLARMADELRRYVHKEIFTPPVAQEGSEGQIR